MANLLGQNIGTNYKGILNLNTLNGNLSGTLQAVTDGDGNASPLQLSTTQVAVVATTPILTIQSTSVTGLNTLQMLTNLGAVRASYSADMNSGEVRLFVGSGGFFQTFYANNVEAMRLTTSQNLVIGATTASARLHVRGDGTNPIITGDLADGIFRFRVTDNRVFSGGSGSFGAGGFELLNGDNSTTIFRLTRSAEAGLSVQSLVNIGFSLGSVFSASAYHAEWSRTGGGHILYKMTGTNSTVSIYTGDGSSNIGWVGTESNHSFGILTNNNYRLIVSNSGLIQFGGTTNAFPALKRNGAALEVRLADDSANASLNAAAFNTASCNIGSNFIAIGGDSGFLRPAASTLAISLNGFSNNHFEFRKNSDTTVVGIIKGTGSPEGVITANQGSIFLRTDGGAGTSFYVKESGTGNTGWVAK